MGSELGLTSDQLHGVVAATIDPSLYDDATVAALDYADAMTLGDVDDDTFAAVASHFDEPAIVELTEVIAWENASARFNRALRIPSQKLWNDENPS